MSELIAISVLTVSQLIFYFFGNQILKDYIITKDNVNKLDPLLKFVFFFTICSSLTLLELIGCEILDLFPRNFRWFFWKLNLILLLGLLILIVPFLQIRMLLITERSNSKLPKLVILGFLIYLWCFYKLRSIFPVISETKSNSFFSIEQGLGRIGIIGITLMALISGYGSVAGPAGYIFVQKVSSDHLESAERNYKNAQKVLEEKREKFQQICERKISEKPSEEPLNWFLKRVSTAINFNNSNQDNLAEEISNLDLVVKSLQQEYESLSYEHDRHVYSETINGKLLKVLGHFLSFYCIYRIFSAIFNILLGRIGRADPVTVGIGFFVHIFGVEWDVQLWAKEISFIFVGCLIISSIKNFLSEVLKILRIVDRNEHSKALVLFSTQLIGLYVTSTILMLRLNLPLSSRPILTELLKGVEFDFFEKWFDGIYIFAAIASVIYIYNSKIK